MRCPLFLHIGTNPLHSTYRCTPNRIRPHSPPFRSGAPPLLLGKAPAPFKGGRDRGGTALPIGRGGRGRGCSAAHGRSRRVFTSSARMRASRNRARRGDPSRPEPGDRAAAALAPEPHRSSQPPPRLVPAATRAPERAPTLPAVMARCDNVTANGQLPQRNHS